MEATGGRRSSQWQMELLGSLIFPPTPLTSLFPPGSESQQPSRWVAAGNTLPSAHLSVSALPIPIRLQRQERNNVVAAVKASLIQQRFNISVL